MLFWAGEATKGDALSRVSLLHLVVQLDCLFASCSASHARNQPLLRSLITKTLKTSWALFGPAVALSVLKNVILILICRGHAVF